MPTPVNLKGGGLQLGTYFTVSIVYRAFASVSDQAVEVAIGVARYVSVDLFGARNQGGTFFGAATIDLGSQTVLEMAKATTIDDALANIFPPPGTDT